MQLESHATPCGGTPQQRYATLHRAIERGLDSDELWRQLAEVSIRLGHHGEAVRCVRRIRNSAERHAMEYKLGRLGLLRHDANPASAIESEAPADHRDDSDDENHPSLVEHLLDAAQYLMHQQMPWLVLTTMLAFPIVIGIGGFLTAGGSLLLLAAISALPGMCVLAIIGAMGRQILLTSAAGESDVPGLSGFGHLVVEARRFAVDALLVSVTFLTAPITAALLGAPWSVTVPLFATAGLLAPIAFALRTVRGDFRAIAPMNLLRAMIACGRAYPVLAAVTVAMFVPAMVVTSAVIDRPIWVQIALVGPICVLPIYAASRLLGSWLDTHRHSLGQLLHTPAQPPVASAEPVAPSEPANSVRKQRFPRRPDALRHFEAPVAKPAGTKRAKTRPAPASALNRRPQTQPPAARAAASARPQGQRPPQPQPQPPRPRQQQAATQRPAARAIEGRRPDPRRRPAPPAPSKRPAAASASARPAARAKQAASAQAASRPGRPTRRPQPKRSARAPLPNDGPDLAMMPGATVVTGSDRETHGAASRRR